MFNEIIPVPNENQYRMIKWGLYGELGEGENAKVRFLQTVINHDELDDIELISSIPGSERWDVRDLFQRDVDDERITQDILPYFNDTTKVKYFNPLTLIVLPMDESKRNVIKSIEYVEPKNEKEGDQEYTVFEKLGYYKFKRSQRNKLFGCLEWNDKKCYLVAIDGQHRLSALKRMKKSASADTLSRWIIPVIILNIYKVDPSKDTANLLEIVRKTFVYINTQAVRVNRAREILLNDENINAICTQEIIQFSHGNDNLPPDHRNDDIIPLMFFDWRGETERLRPKPGVASVKSVEELYSWFDSYILGENGSDKQEIELCLKDMVPPLDIFSGKSNTISFKDAFRIRKYFHDNIMPGILYFLQYFTPYKEYIKACREIEIDSLRKSDISQHAFMKLRFGIHNAGEDQIDAVNTEFNNLVDKFDGLKIRMLPGTLGLDIGMRGMIYAFSAAKKEYETTFRTVMSWIDYAKMALDEFNEIYADGWLKSWDDLEKHKKHFLTHVIFDKAGSIINYKLQQAEDSLGAFLTVLFFQKKWKKKELNDVEFEEIRNTYCFNLKKTIEKGYRKEIKADLIDKFTGKPVEFNKEVRKRPNKLQIKEGN